MAEKRLKFAKCDEDDGFKKYEIYTNCKLDYYCGYLFFDTVWMWDNDGESIVFDEDEIKELYNFIDKLKLEETNLN